jgi:hypothetical protein
LPRDDDSAGAGEWQKIAGSGAAAVSGSAAPASPVTSNEPSVEKHRRKMPRRSRCTVAERSPPSKSRRGAARNQLRLAAFFVLASASLFACGSLLGIDSPRILSRGADGGEAGANHEGGAAGESPAGGVAGTASGRGGTHASGSGGASGSGAGHGGSAGDAGANAGGAAGEPPDPGPTLGAACDNNVEYSCTTANPNITLACDSGTWILNSICRRDERCNAASAEGVECEKVDPLCAASTKAVCASNSSVTDCGVSQFQPPSRICPYGCQAGRCLPGTGDELIVHTDDDNQSGGPRWDEIRIPVCFLESDANAPLPARIRSEAERTWGRYLNVEFTGWGECSSATVAGVVIEFLEGCELRLGGKPPNGFLGREEQSRVGICSSYQNAARVLEHMERNQPLLRFVARHQFGHVLGLSEWERPSTDTDTVMVRALEKSNAARLELTHNDLDFFAFRYGHKPSGTLVTTSGLCLTPVDSAIRPAPCSQSGSGRFLFESGEVRSLLAGAPGCLTLSGGDSVGLGPCGTASSALRMARARWSTPDRCVAPDFPGPGSAIATRACAPVGDLSQAWFFEIVDKDQEKLSARLRFSATGDCLSVTGVRAMSYDAPVLERCSETILARHVFYLWSDGQISFGEMMGPTCLHWEPPDSTLYFGTCNDDTYWLSGALETPDGLALAIAPSDPNAELLAVSLGSNELPNDEQIFDFAF